jgi:pSer/pThr/pTyr-binding forkhead associated (FHA) protein
MAALDVTIQPFSGLTYAVEVPMAKLSLTFEHRKLRDFSLTKGVTTIGRLPDNMLQIDNPAVSGHHARVFWDSDHFVIEDRESLNGTFINDQRVARQELRDGDRILIGKHTVIFAAEPLQEVAPASYAYAAAPLPAMDGTAMLDTKKARELLAKAAAARAGAHAPADTGVLATQAIPVKQRVGILSVFSGKTDQNQYVLTSKVAVIGKSEMASIRLRGWFAPKVVATVSRREDRYFITPSDGRHKVKVNGAHIAGQAELSNGDNISVAGVQMTFSYAD